MALFEIRWKKSAKAELRKLPKSIIQRIIKAVEKLAIHPYPHGCRKIQGTTQTYRIRVGDYRVLYSIESAILLIEIIRAGHRKDVYDNFP
jgi:mRNA interferase RelE/StbE